MPEKSQYCSWYVRCPATLGLTRITLVAKIGRVVVVEPCALIRRRGRDACPADVAVGVLGVEQRRNAERGIGIGREFSPADLEWILGQDHDPSAGTAHVG